MIKRSVHDWLELWGEWERCGRAYLAHLQPKSPMGICMDSLLPTNKMSPPEIDDDGALWFCGILTRLRRSRPKLFEVLLWVHVQQLSMREVASRLQLNRIRTGETYERAIGWLDAMIEAELAIAEIKSKKGLQGGCH